MKKVLILAIATITFVIGFCNPAKAEDNLLGRWVCQSCQPGKPKQGSEVTITFGRGGIGKAGLNFLYTDIEPSDPSDVDGELLAYALPERIFYYAVDGTDMITDGKGNIEEYTVVKIWFPPKGEIIAISILFLDEGKILIIKDDGRKYVFTRPEQGC
jgi:hypothetical protein